MSQYLQQLEALRHHPALQVTPEQRPAVVGNILHHLMCPYFLKRTPEMQEKFGEPQYQAFMQALGEYCLREYIENPEPRLTIEFIKGLHRQFYGNAPSVQVKAVDGSMTLIAPGEFKSVPVFTRRGEEWVAMPTSNNLELDLAQLLDRLHSEATLLFQRYIRCMFDFTALHPFPDSNGKMALLLGDLFLLKQGVAPPCFARYRWSNKQDLYLRAERYSLEGQRDVADLYPVVLGLYVESGLGLSVVQGAQTNA